MCERRDFFFCCIWGWGFWVVLVGLSRAFEVSSVIVIEFVRIVGLYVDSLEAVWFFKDFFKFFDRYYFYFVFYYYLYIFELSFSIIKKYNVYFFLVLKK